MSKLRGDIWADDTSNTEASNPSRRPGKPPVRDIKVWLECFVRMAALITTRFPEKVPELWAHQTTILKAAQNYEGSNWVAYDRQFRRDMLARRDLNWSVPNTRLYNEAFTGIARSIPRCPHSLSEDHAGTSCLHNPNPPLVVWIQAPPQLQTGFLPNSVIPPVTTSNRPATMNEICRNYNENRCRFTRCRYRHICSECAGAHPAILCQHRLGTPGRGPSRRNRNPRTQVMQQHPYFPPASPGIAPA